MHILYLAQQYDYGDASRGYSFEHYNFYLSLLAMGHRLTYFDYPTEATTHGRRGANQRLESIVNREQPDALFAVLRHDTIDKRTIQRISDNTDTVTINWFCDDHWQFESQSRKWTPCFNHVVTTSNTALKKYREHRFNHVIKSQWGANHALYKPTAGQPIHDVTFVGQPYGIRSEAIDALQRAGIKVRAWGNGWPSGKLSQDEMIRVFGQSRINLNFADASSAGRTRLQTIAASHAIGALRDKPLLWRAWDWSQRAAHWDKQRRGQAAPPPRQIKGRTFEVPACGGFLLTQPAEDLADYLQPGKDCATFETVDELVHQVRYYLSQEDERQAIAKQGYERTLAEHTYTQRFREVFAAAGLDTRDEQTPDNNKTYQSQAA